MSMSEKGRNKEVSENRKDYATRAARRWEISRICLGISIRNI
jgi:hypothetical protein